MAEYKDFFKDVEPIEVIFDCDICKDELFVVCDEEHADIETSDILTLDVIYKRECVCYKNKKNKLKFERKMKQSNLLSIYDEIKNTEYETKYDWQKEYKNHVDTFIRNNDPALIISGQTGSGKSLLLGKALGNLMHLGRDCYYMQWGQDFKKLVNQYNKVGEEEEKFFRYLSSVDVLYIDDLFKTRSNDIASVERKRIEIDMFWELLNKRMYLKDCKTMISTELFESDFAHLDNSLRGRLLQLVTKKENWIQMCIKEDRDIRVKKFNGEF